MGAYGFATFDGPSFAVRGPEGHAIATATGGVGYEAGWRLIGEADLDTSFRPFAADVDWDVAFDAGIGPYAVVEGRVDVRLGRGVLSFSLAEAAFADIEAQGGLALKLEPPLDPLEPAYRGPRWNLGYAASGHLKAEFTGGALVRIARKLGVSVSGLSTELFSLEGTLLSSPTPVLTAPGSRFDLGIPEQRRITLSMAAETSETGTAEFLYARSGEGRLKALAQAPYASGATHPWVPAKGDAGRWDLYPRLAVGILGSVKPYASDSPLTLEVVTPSLDVADSVAMAGIIGETARGSLLVQNAPPDRAYGSELRGTVSASAPLGVSPTTLSLPAGGSAGLDLTYPCSQKGEFTGSVLIQSNDPERPSASVPVAVSCDENKPPVVDLGPSGPLSGTAPLTVTIAWGVTDPEGQPVTCTLSYGDGSPVETIADCATDTSRTHVYNRGGDYPVTFTAQDDHGGTAAAGLTISVNEPPVVDTFSATPSSGDPPLTVTFVFAASDPEGDTLTCTLDPGDGSGPRSSTCAGETTHEYTQEGRYTASFRVEDARGGAATATVTIQVGVGPCSAGPTAMATANGTDYGTSFYFDPVTGDCQFTDSIVGSLDFIGSPDGMGSLFFYVLDKGFTPWGNMYMTGPPQPNAGWTPNYFGDQNLAYLTPNTPTLIQVEIRDVNGATLAQYQGTFEILWNGSGAPQMTVTDFDRIPGP